MLKKICVLAALCLALSLAGCGKDADGPASEKNAGGNDIGREAEKEAETRLADLEARIRAIDFSALPGTNWADHIGDAAFGGGDGGSEEVAIEISSPEQLALLARNVNNGDTYEGKYLVLTADIDLGDHLWIPIGLVADDTQVGSFSGNFNGNNHTISRLTIFKDKGFNLSGPYTCGLFGLMSGNLSNLSLTDAVISSRIGVIGGLCALNSGRISNCSVQGVLRGVGVITGGSADGGGLISIAGLAQSNQGVIIDSFADVRLIGEREKIVPYRDMAPRGGEIGGLVVSNRGVIDNCYAVGIAYSASRVYPIYQMGGISAYNKLESFFNENSDYTPRVLNSYSAMTLVSACPGVIIAGVSGVFDGIGGDAAIIDNCHYDEEAAGGAVNFDSAEGVSKRKTAEMAYNEEFVSLLNGGKASDPVWLMDTENVNHGYPVLNRAAPHERQYDHVWKDPLAV